MTGAVRQSSPFLAIAPAARWALIVYFLVYHAIFPAIAAAMHGDTGSLVAVRVLLQFILSALTVLPLIFYRHDYGWLHPLILPTLFGIMKEVVKYPLHLILPFSVPLESFTPGTTSAAYSLVMDPDALERIRVGYALTNILALSCYYAGYFYLPRLRVPEIRFRAPSNLRPLCFSAVFFCIAIASVWIISSGGLSSYLIAMRGGRVALFEGAGQFITIGEFSFTIVLLWFMYEARPFFNPAWLLAFISAAATTLVVSGSRAGLIYSLVTLLLIWWWKRDRILIGIGVLFGVAALIVFGVFGSIRQDYGSDRIDYSILSTQRFEEIFQRASAEFERRQDEEANVAAFAGALDKGLLWGRTYLGAAAFWIPRGIWNGKPRSADAYNMWVNFQGRSLDQPFSEGRLWGIPVGPVVEAFWNFHVLGVIGIFLLYGQFHAWLANWIRKYPREPAVFLPVMMILIQFSATSLTFVTVARDILLLLALCKLLGVWNFGRVRAPLRYA